MYAPQLEESKQWSKPVCMYVCMYLCKCIIQFTL